METAVLWHFFQPYKNYECGKCFIFTIKRRFSADFCFPEQIMLFGEEREGQKFEEVSFMGGHKF